MAKVLVVSNSTLSRVASCSTKTWLAARGWQGKALNAPMEVGKLFHAAFANHFTGMLEKALWDAFEAGHGKLASIDGLFDDPKNPGSVEPGFTYQNLSMVLKEWMERNPLSQLPFMVTKTEIPFARYLGTVNLGGSFVLDVELTGVIDALAVNQAGLKFIIESKTTRRNIDAAFIRKFWMDSQNTAYLWSQRGGGETEGTYINAVRVAKLPDSIRKCRDHGMLYAECGRLHAQMGLYYVDRGQETENWKNDALKLAHKFGEILVVGDLDRVPQEGKFSNMCADCEFYAFCRAGRPRNIESYLEPERPDVTDTRLKSGLWEQDEILSWMEKTGKVA